MVKPGPAPKTVEELFWPKVQKTDGCWVWTASVFQGSLGYGQFNHPRLGRPVMAHRVAYELEVGPIPEGLEIDHLCSNPRCVRPDHLRAITPKENQRRNKFSLASSCINGHPFTPENTYMYRNHRYCRECRKINDRNHYVRYGQEHNLPRRGEI